MLFWISIKQGLLLPWHQAHLVQLLDQKLIYQRLLTLMDEFCANVLSSCSNIISKNCLARTLFDTYYTMTVFLTDNTAVTEDFRKNTSNLKVCQHLIEFLSLFFLQWYSYLITFWNFLFSIPEFQYFVLILNWMWIHIFSLSPLIYTLYANKVHNYYNNGF